MKKTPDEILNDFMMRYARIPVTVMRATEKSASKYGLEEGKPKKETVVEAGVRMCRIGHPMATC